jgi:quinol-cytochrome oxidoreductase complex cytochrome b subunit
MTTHAKDAHCKDSWAFTRLPGLGALCATFCQKTRAPGASYFETLPFLISIAAAFLTLSGIVLAVYYNPWHAFDSVQFIERNVNNGWLIRTYHATGTTMIFAVTYIYLFRSILTRAYRAPGEFVWMLNVKLLAVLLLTGWLGYVLTGGAAGYWSLFNAANAAISLGGLPGAVGMWFFGGPAGGDTLARLEVFHALLAVSLLLVVWMIHASRRVIAPAAPARAVAFYPYYLAQYFAALAVFALIFAFLVFYAPHVGTSHMNRVPAESLAVPVGAGVPWYLAPAAGLIGVFPSAALSIFGAIAAAVVLYALPWLDRSGANGARGRLYGFFVWVLALDVLGLGWAANSSCAFAATLAGLFTGWFFFHFLILTPVVTAMEAE